MKKNEFTCPKCGANLVVTENKINMKAKERIEALKAAGVDVSNLFAVIGGNGEEMVAKNEGGTLQMLSDNDPIFEMIICQGTVPNRNLFRRWVMSQSFHMLDRIDRSGMGATELIQWKGYEYGWTMLINELHAQFKMFGKDKDNLAARFRWFNHELVLQMMKDYIVKLEEYCKTLPVKHCKGVPYKRVCGKNVFVSDLKKKIFEPLTHCYLEAKRAETFSDYYYATKKFNDKRIKMNWKTPLYKCFIDAYKGCGAYYTMQNLIRFHGCHFFCGGDVLNKEQSLSYLERLAEESKSEGWRLFGIMKKFIKDNGIDVHKSIENWRK